MNDKFLEQKKSAYRSYASTLTLLYLDDVISKEQYIEFLSKTKEQYDIVIKEIRGE